MAFMSLHTRSGLWITYDDKEGGHVLSLLDLLTSPERAAIEKAFEAGGTDKATAIERLCTVIYIFTGADTIDGDSVGLRWGYCARYSAPGYMDCTEWCGPYPTLAQAENEADRLYGDESEEG